jgi:hypothetical protein
MTLSVTASKGRSNRVIGTQKTLSKSRPIFERDERYPEVDEDELEPTDAVNKSKLHKQKQRYDKDAPFTNPGPNDEEVAFRPEAPFNFPALPVAISNVIVTGQVLKAEAHRSENKLNIFSNLSVRVDEVWKGSVSLGDVITIQRIGGFVKYPNGRRVLFRLAGNGMPEVEGRYVFFLKTNDEDYSILTAYEFGTDGVEPLDNSRQFEAYKGLQEQDFLASLRAAISHPLPQ